MAVDEKIGGIYVDISGDYSDLETKLAEAVSKAESAGKDIAAALMSAASGGDQLADRLEEAMASISGSARAAATDVASAFSGITIEAVDISAVTDSLSAISDAAVKTGSDVSGSLSGTTLEAPDTEAILAKFDELAAQAASAADKIGSDFTRPIAAPDTAEFIAGMDAMKGVAAEVGGTITTFSGDLGGLQSAIDATGGSAADQEAKLSALEGAMDAAAQKAEAYAGSAQEIYDKQTEANSALSDAQSVLAQVQSDFDAGKASASDLARAADQVQKSFSAAHPEIKTAGDNAHEAAEGGFAELAGELLKLGGIALTAEALLELGKDALTANDNLTRASIGLTALTGNAEQAKSTIEGLEELGMKDGLAMPSLLSAGERMQALLGPGANVVALLGSIANGAAVMNTPIETAARMFDNMAANGTVMKRSLGDIGLTMQTLADAVNDVNPRLNATADNITAVFKAMSESDRVDALTDAFSKLNGVAKDVADNTFGGQWTRVANTFEADMATIGGGISPIIQLMPKIGDAITYLTAGISMVGTAIKLVVDGVVGLTTTAFTALQAMGNVWIDVMSGNVQGLAADVATAWGDIKSASTFTWDSMKSDATAGEQTIESLAGKLSTATKDGLDKAGESFGTFNTKVGEAKDGFQKLSDQAASIMAKLPDEYGEYVSKLSDGGEKAESALKGIQAEIDKLNAKQDEMPQHAAQVQSLIDKLEAARAKAQEFADEDAFAKIGNQLGDLDAKAAGVNADLLNDFNAILDSLAQIPGAVAQHGQELIKWLQQAQQEQEKLDQQTQKTQKTLDTAWDKYVNKTQNEAIPITATLAERLGNVDTTFQSADRSISNAAATLANYVHAVGDLGVGYDGLTTKQHQIIADFDTIASSGNSSWQMVQASYDKASGSIKQLGEVDLPALIAKEKEHTQALIDKGAPYAAVVKSINDEDASVKVLAQTNLPAAIAAEQAHIDKLKAYGGPIQDIAAGYQNMDKMQLQWDQDNITVANHEHANASQFIIDEGLKANAATDSANSFRNIWGNVWTDFNKLSHDATTQLGSALTDGITGAKSWSDAFTGFVKSIEKEIVNELVNTVLKATLQPALDAAMAGFAKILGPGGGGVTGAIPAFGQQVTQAIPPLQGLSQGATSAGGAASSVGGIFGQLGGTINVISGAFSAVTGVIGVFQNAQMEATEKLIELNTRITAIVTQKELPIIAATGVQEEATLNALWNSMLDMNTGMFNRLGDIWGTLQDGFAPLAGKLDEIWDQLDKIRSVLSGGLSATSGTPGASDLSGKALDALTGIWADANLLVEGLRNLALDIQALGSISAQGAAQSKADFQGLFTETAAQKTALAALAKAQGDLAAAQTSGNQQLIDAAQKELQVAQDQLAAANAQKATASATQTNTQQTADNTGKAAASGAVTEANTAQAATATRAAQQGIQELQAKLVTAQAVLANAVATGNPALIAAANQNLAELKSQLDQARMDAAATQSTITAGAQVGQSAVQHLQAQLVAAQNQLAQAIQAGNPAEITAAQGTVAALQSLLTQAQSTAAAAQQSAQAVAAIPPAIRDGGDRGVQAAKDNAATVVTALDEKIQQLQSQEETIKEQMVAAQQANDQQAVAALQAKLQTVQEGIVAAEGQLITAQQATTSAADATRQAIRDAESARRQDLTGIVTPSLTNIRDTIHADVPAVSQAVQRHIAELQAEEVTLNDQLKAAEASQNQEAIDATKSKLEEVKQEIATSQAELVATQKNTTAGTDRTTSAVRDQITAQHDTTTAIGGTTGAVNGLGGRIDAVGVKIDGAIREQIGAQRQTIAALVALPPAIVPPITGAVNNLPPAIVPPIIDGVAGAVGGAVAPLIPAVNNVPPPIVAAVAASTGLITASVIASGGGASGQLGLPFSPNAPVLSGMQTLEQDVGAMAPNAIVAQFHDLLSQLNAAEDAGDKTKSASIMAQLDTLRKAPSTHVFDSQGNPIGNALGQKTAKVGDYYSSDNMPAFASTGLAQSSAKGYSVPINAVPSGIGIAVLAANPDGTFSVINHYDYPPVSSDSNFVIPPKSVWESGLDRLNVKDMAAQAAANNAAAIGTANQLGGSASPGALPPGTPPGLAPTWQPITGNAAAAAVLGAGSGGVTPTSGALPAPGTKPTGVSTGTGGGGALPNIGGGAGDAGAGGITATPVTGPGEVTGAPVPTAGPLPGRTPTGAPATSTLDTIHDDLTGIAAILSGTGQSGVPLPIAGPLPAGGKPTGGSPISGSGGSPFPNITGGGTDSLLPPLIDASLQLPALISADTAGFFALKTGVSLLHTDLAALTALLTRPAIPNLSPYAPGPSPADGSDSTGITFGDVTIVIEGSSKNGDQLVREIMAALQQRSRKFAPRSQ